MGRYRLFWRQTLVRLVLTYLAPLLLLTLYFHLQYRGLAEEAHRAHLLAVAESQAGTLDLFLRERLVNLRDVIDALSSRSAPRSAWPGSCSAGWQRDSSTFVDLGFFGERGAVLSYAGPYPALQARSYGQEEWSPPSALGTPIRHHRHVSGLQAPSAFHDRGRHLGNGQPVAVRATRTRRESTTT